jgi:hypothetical protein
MYATKQQLLNLIGVMENSSTSLVNDYGSNADHHQHGMFDSVDRNRLEAMRIELETEIAESEIPRRLIFNPTINPETK